MTGINRWLVKGIDWADRVDSVRRDPPMHVVVIRCAVCGEQGPHGISPLGVKNGTHGQLMTSAMCLHQWIMTHDSDPQCVHQGDRPSFERG